MIKKNTLFVSFSGGPGTGKSTMAASVFAELKYIGIDCELISEYAKQLVWEHAPDASQKEELRHAINPKLKNQVYIFAKQHNKQFILNGKVSVALTDAPLILGLYYNNDEILDKLALSENKKFNNLHIFLNRKKEYNPNGRMQTLEQAIEIDNKLKSVFISNNINFVEFDAVKQSVAEIVALIKSKI